MGSINWYAPYKFAESNKCERAAESGHLFSYSVTDTMMVGRKRPLKIITVVEEDQVRRDLVGVLTSKCCVSASCVSGI